MKRILVIEPSETLRQALSRLAGHKHELITVNEYAAAMTILQNNPSGDNNFDLVILGSWTQLYPYAVDVLSLLDSGSWANIPVIMLGQDEDTIALSWVGRRPCSAVLTWAEYTRLPGVMENLFGESVARQKQNLEDNIGQVRILLADDSSTSRFSYGNLLRRHGYAVVTANDGSEALEKLKKSGVDIAIVDYFMPDMNGDELCRRIAADPDTRNIHTAVLTATYLDHIISSALDAGAVDCMFKTEADALFLARVDAISRLIRGRKKVDAERQRFESILTSVGSGVFGIDLHGKITFVNPAARNILGLNQGADLAGKSPEDVFYGEDSPLTNISDKNSAPYGIARRGEFHTSDGKKVPVEYSVYPLIIQGVSEGHVISFTDMSAQYELQDKLLWQATHDPLTGLSNRRHFEEEMRSRLKMLRDQGGSNALLYIDLDQFKYINDTLGHSAGDELLKEVAGQLQSRLRESDFIARLGGDEFAVILRGVKHHDVFEVSDQLRDMLHQCNFAYEGKNYKVNGSVGVVVFDGTEVDLNEVLAYADIACHIAKRKGRNQTHVYSPDDNEKSEMDADFSWSMRLREALQNNEFVIGFQPILPLDTVLARSEGDDLSELWQEHREKPGVVEHYEVLVRLKDKDGSLIPANVFMGPAERFNLLREIDMHVLKRSFRLMNAFRAMGRNVVFSINLSGNTMAVKGLSKVILDLFRRNDIDPKNVIFEITERVAIDNLDAAKGMMEELQGYGVRFALDDFGTGFSSFSHLKNLPVDVVKIDGSFIRDMDNDPVDQALVASINDIAHSLGRKTVAEFVGNKETLLALQRCGVDYVQGDFISSTLADIGASSRTTITDIQKYRHRRVQG